MPPDKSKALKAAAAPAAAGKGKKKRNSKDSLGSTEKKKVTKGKKKGGASGGGGGGGKSKSNKFQGDIFNEGAMENAYYICHNVQDVLKNRGFPWPDGAKKKKKGRKK